MPRAVSLLGVCQAREPKQRCKNRTAVEVLPGGRRLRQTRYGNNRPAGPHHRERALQRLAAQKVEDAVHVYSNFESKEAIFLAVLEAHCQEGLDGLLGRIDRAADTGEVIELLADWADSRSRSGGWSLTILEHARIAAQGSASMRRQEEIIRGHWRQVRERILPHLRDERSSNPELLGALLHEIAYAPALTFVDKPTAGELMRLSMSALLRD